MKVVRYGFIAFIIKFVYSQVTISDLSDKINLISRTIFITKSNIYNVYFEKIEDF